MQRHKHTVYGVSMSTYKQPAGRRKPPSYAIDTLPSSPPLSSQSAFQQLLMQHGEVKISPWRSVFCDLIHLFLLLLNTQSQACISACGRGDRETEERPGLVREQQSYLQTIRLWWEPVKYSLKLWMGQTERSACGGGTDSHSQLKDKLEREGTQLYKDGHTWSITSPYFRPVTPRNTKIQEIKDF